MPVKKELPVKLFPSAASWEKWLKAHGGKSEGIWLKLAKKTTKKKTVTYVEALDIALSYGWIDAVKNGFDDSYWLQKFTPRRARSMWSKINTGHAERLINEGRMTPAGLKVIEDAKRDGRWKRAYSPAKTSVIPPDFLRELKKDKAVFAFFQTLNKANLYAITYRLETAKKPETREKRMQTILAMMKAGKKFH